MAIYHLSTNPISRSSGRSAVASIAYRAGITITDERLGKTYDYTKRSGVLYTGMVTPNGIQTSRNELWNLAEKTENRSNSRTAREIVINIPHELMQGDQSTGKMLAYEFANQLSDKYQVAVDIAVHSPDKAGDNRNFHAHLLLTTRKIEQTHDGKIKLAEKSQLEMSNTQLKQAGLLSNQDELKQIRKAWADLTNDYLAEHGIDERIDHRSHKDRGLETLPTVKMGWKATEMERNGIRTDVGDKNRDIRAYNANLLQEKILASEIVIQQTLKNASKTPIEPHKDSLARVTPPTHIKSLQSENKATSEPNELDVKAQIRQIIQNGKKDGSITSLNELKNALVEQGYTVVKETNDKIRFKIPHSDEHLTLKGDMFPQDELTQLKAKLEPTAIKERYPQISDVGIAQITAWKDHIMGKYTTPQAQQEILYRLDSSVKDVANGKDLGMPPIPANEIKPNIDVQISNQNHDNSKGR